METSGGTPPVRDLQGCLLKGQYTWESLQSLTIGGLRPYTDYTITILPVNRGKRQVAATERVRTKEGRSGPVTNLRTSTINGYLRVLYDQPQQPNGVVTNYKVKVVLRRREICDKVEDRILKWIMTYDVSYTYEDIPLKDLTRCGHHVIEVAAVNGWSLDGGVGETSSVTFDYKPDISLAISTPVARPVSSNMIQISWVHPNLKDDCPKTGFLVEVANRGRPSDCVSQIIYDGGCPQLDDMLRRVISCLHNETRNVTKEGPSWVLHIGGSFRPSETYEVKIWKISDRVLRQEGPPSISFEDQGCFTDCYGSTYVGVRSHRGCVAWKNSFYKWTHPSRMDSLCSLKNADKPWCGTRTSYAYCNVPRCSLVVRATGCVRDVQEATGTSNVTLRWAPPPLGPPPIGYIIMLHRINGICERSHLQTCDACGDEASLTEEVRAFLVSCGNRSVTKGVLHGTTFDNLHQNRAYRVYIVPLVTPSTYGEVRKVSIRTLLARPATPKNLRLLNRTTQSLTFRWEQSVEDADNGPTDSYEVTLRKGAFIVKFITSKTEGCTFQGLEMCTEYRVSLYGKNTAGRSEIDVELSQYTLAPSLGEVEVKDVPSEPLDHRDLSWRYLGGDTCHKYYRVRYRNEYMMMTERIEVTSLTSILLTSLDKNMVYIVDVRAQTTLDTEDGRKEGRYSPGKEFYTGTVRPEIYGIEKELTSRGMKLNVSWSFNTSNDGSVFEFILLVKNASDLCINVTHFICRSCPPPYTWENLNEGNKSRRSKILNCSPPNEVLFTKDSNSLYRFLEMDVPLSNYTVEVFAVNLVGVHHVYGKKTVYDSSRPATPKNLRLLFRTTKSLTFRWDQSVEEADNGPTDFYEMTLRKGASIVKSITSKTEGCTFQGLEMCTEYHASLYGKNAAGRSEIDVKLSQYTLAPSLGEVEVKDGPSEPLDHHHLSWRYLGVDTCHKSYKVRYRNKYMRTDRFEVTSETSIHLMSLDKNMVYIVDVMAQTTLDTEDGRKVGRFSHGKEFYTGTVRPEIYGIEKALTSRGMRLNVSWSFNTSNDGSVFEFILLVKNASDLCISTTHFICRSCPPPYAWENLNESHKSKRKEILKCSPPQEVLFTKYNNNLNKLFEMAVPLNNVFLEIFSINLVGVHHVNERNRWYNDPADVSKSSAVSIVMVSFLLLFLAIILVLLLKFKHQPKILYDVIFQKPTSNGIPNKGLISPASTVESGVSNIEDSYNNKKVQRTPIPKITKNSYHLETKESLPLLEPKRKSNGVSLKDFPRHFEKMTSNKKEPLIQEYKKLTTECRKMETDLGLTVNMGKSRENTKKNLFVNILPFDQTRVIIDGKTNDYTNANFIPFLADETSYEYIASQGPIEDSINDFWQMIWKQNVNCIVMLTRTMEDNKFKCLQYWPDNIGEEQTYGNREVLTVTLQEETKLESHIERVMVVKEADNGQERVLIQLHMYTWFDHSAPNLEYFDQLLFRFHELTNETVTNPYLIYCSAGVGSTGTFICIDRIIKQLVNGFQEISIYDTVFKMRHYRNFMVQTKAQYIFIHDYINHFLKTYIKADDAGDVLYFNEG